MGGVEGRGGGGGEGAPARRRSCSSVPLRFVQLTVIVCKVTSPRFVKSPGLLKSVFLQSFSKCPSAPLSLALSPPWLPLGFHLLLFLLSADPACVFLQQFLKKPKIKNQRKEVFLGGGAGLDNGVPIEIILDVVGRHAMHLEVSGRDHVLLVHLCVVSCHRGSCAAHWGHVRISWRTHHGHTLSGIHVEISCVEVLAGFVGVHGAVADRRLWRPLWLDHAGAGEELVDG